ncbi:hypothetical protein V1514DRAFT_324581 [Lipomyces japonicus]|uniref:uncharacterized protein n=1 Tax=Lipomyces japonicus TaxID=56871 RepID=UPI0034CD3989
MLSYVSSQLFLGSFVFEQNFLLNAMADEFGLDGLNRSSNVNFETELTDTEDIYDHEDDDNVVANLSDLKDSKKTDIADFRNLLHSLEVEHRESLGTHITVATRLRNIEEQKARANGSTSARLSGKNRAIKAKFTAWPLPLAKLPNVNNSRYDFSRYDSTTAPSLDDDVSETPVDQYDYEFYRLPTSELFAPPVYAKPLMTEISAIGIRSLTNVWRRAGIIDENSSFGADDVLSNEEIEKSMLYPHLHSHSLKFIDSLFTSLAFVRNAKFDSISRGGMDWVDLLNAASIVGFPTLDTDDRWLSVIKKVKDQCEKLFSVQGGFEYEVTPTSAKSTPSTQHVRGFKKRTHRKLDLKEEVKHDEANVTLPYGFPPSSD